MAPHFQIFLNRRSDNILAHDAPIFHYENPAGLAGDRRIVGDNNKSCPLGLIQIPEQIH